MWSEKEEIKLSLQLVWFYVEKIHKHSKQKQLWEPMREFRKIIGYVVNNKNNYVSICWQWTIKNNILKEYYLQ